LFDGENILFDASLVIYTYTRSTNIGKVIQKNQLDATISY